MKATVEQVKVIPNRTMEIANLYHKQSLELINLALTHNKKAIEASHNRATELLQVKDTKNIHELVTAHMSSQIRDYLSFAGAGLEGASSHSGRRTFLTTLANKGTAIHILKTLAGHRSISTTAAYLYSSPSQLKAAVELV
jgi:site-specific recombinase XerD